MRILQNHVPKLFVFIVALATLVKTPIAASELTKPDPQVIIEKIQARLEQIDDYRVTARVNVDIPNLRMPDKKLTIFYKSPDKLSVKTSGFAIVPKIGFLPSVKDLITEDMGVTFKNTLREDGATLYVLELTSKELPVETTASIWVNSKRWTVEKVLFRVENAGESVINLYYLQVDSFWLPESTVVYLNMERGIPHMNRPTVENPVGTIDHRSRNKSRPVSGKVLVTFEDYRINQGLDDSLFEE
ncbi:MAG: hypothetical protein KAT54_09190 [Candidatus Marinimicrobia bacterium]|nr:hypothetical protein [Candidatus Neomarinimicrobiota bacterium]